MIARIAKSTLHRFLLPMSFLLLAVIFAVPLALAQEANPAGPEPHSISLDLLNEHDIQLLPEMKGILGRIRDAAQKGDAPRIGEGVASILKVKKGLDTRNLFPVSDCLIVEAQRAALLKQFPAALALIDGAEKISPDYGRVNFEKGSLLLKESPGNIVAALASLHTGFHKTLQIRAERSGLMAQAYIYLLLTLALSFACFLLLSFLFNLRPIFYDFLAFTPFTYAKIPSRLFASAFLLFPAAVGGLKLFLLAIPAVLWGYVEKQSRAILALFFISLVLAAPRLTDLVARETVISNSPVYRSLDRVSRGDWDHETLGHLKRELNAKNPNPHVYFAFGYIYKKKMEYNEAARNYAKYLEHFPGDPLALANLGATYQEVKDFKTARDYFLAALEKDPNLFEAHLNLNMAYTELVDTQNAKMEYDKAVRLDPERTRNFLEAASKGGNRGNLDCRLPASRVEEYLASLEPRIQGAQAALWNSVGGGLANASFLFYIGGALALLIGFYFYKKSTGGYSQVCVSCGTVFIDPLQISEHAKERCFQCLAASRKKIIDPRMKKELQQKTADNQEKKKKMGMALHFLFPGAGYLFAGRGAVGFILFLFNSFFLVTLGAAFLKNLGGGGTIAGFISANLYFIGALLAYYVLGSLLFFMKLRNE